LFACWVAGTKETVPGGFICVIALDVLFFAAVGRLNSGTNIQVDYYLRYFIYRFIYRRPFARWNVATWDQVFISPRLHDCEWDTAPLGPKHCHYDLVVQTVRTSINENG
jgi:hypothetical protein